jgi:hypothetical protein
VDGTLSRAAAVALGTQEAERVVNYFSVVVWHGPARSRKSAHAPSRGILTDQLFLALLLECLFFPTELEEKALAQDHSWEAPIFLRAPFVPSPSDYS